MSEKQQIEGAAQLEDLKALQVKKPAEPMNIPLEDLVLRHNVRDVSEYNLPPLIESIKRNAFKPVHPLTVHVGPDNLFEVLAGNRRTNALKALTEEERAEALVATDGKVPCLVYRDLTPAQVEVLRCDHGSDEDRQPLSKHGIFVAVCRLLIAGITQVAIATRLGLYVTKDGKKKPNRSLVQIYANAAALPTRVQEMLKQYWLKGEGTIRQSDIAVLSKLWNEEWPTYGINGNEGPKFRAKIQEILDRDSDKPTPTTKGLSPSRAQDTAKVMTSPVTRQLLVAATQADGSALANLDRELKARDELIKKIDWLFANKKTQIEKLLKAAEEGMKTDA